jgi:hypothetical protein
MQRALTRKKIWTVCWWEAIFVRVDGGEFLVRWRDYPGEPRASRSREYIGLLHPALTDL